VPEDFSLTAQQAANYSTLFTSFAALYQKCQTTTQRTPQNIDLKKTAKESLIAETRTLAAQIRSSTTVTDANKIALGLNLGTNEPSPVPTPMTPPTIDIKGAIGRTVTIRLHDAENPSRRGRPYNATGALIYSAVGDQSPQSLDEWTFQGVTGKTTVDVDFPETVAGGSQVSITAAWVGTRSDPRDAAQAIPARIPGGLSQAA